MLTGTREFYLAKLAEKMSGHWSKVGGQIGWYDPIVDVGSFDFDSSHRIRKISQQCLDEEQVIHAENESGQEWIAVPVFNYGRAIGTVLCAFTSVMDSHKEGLFEIFIQQLTHLQQDDQHEHDLMSMSEQLAGSYEELNLVYKLGQQLQICDDPSRFLMRFSSELMEQILAQGLVLWVNDYEGHPESHCEVGRLPFAVEKIPEVCKYLMELTGSISESVILPDLSGHPKLEEIFDLPEYSVLVWPICIHGELLGALIAIGDPLGDGFDSSDAKLMGSAAEHTGSFLQNRFLLTDIQQLLTGLLGSLISAIDAKDPYTRGHSQRVAYIGERIGEAIGLNKKECAQVRMAGLLHDVGKIGVHDDVLGKPGKLTYDEFQTIKQHPVIGSRIVSSVKQLKPILLGILHHHERYDGTGYPEGLAGDEIPIMGLIVGLADCFDAITSERTYHVALSFQEAIAEIKKCSGSQFSPLVVGGLLACDLDQLEIDMKNLPSDHDAIQFLHDFNWLEHWK